MSLILRPYNLFTSVLASNICGLFSSKVSHLSKVLLTALLISLSALAMEANAATYYSRQSGNWNSNTTWSLTSGGAAVGPGIFPVAGDIVIIERTFTVTVTANAACASIQIGATPGGGNFGVLTFGGAFQVIVSGTVAVGGNANANRT